MAERVSTFKEFLHQVKFSVFFFEYNNEWLREYYIYSLFLLFIIMIYYYLLFTIDKSVVICHWLVYYSNIQVSDKKQHFYQLGHLLTTITPSVACSLRLILLYTFF